ncbi:AMP-binding protein [Ochrobactrum sp. Q0168]|uniref:AMP-binding protein n=1 Tax=Ochrobactrum sp. Q0168 TaxID=2793241 RepID=UPI0018EB958C|nr:AMP-binding protein [Ochrobactrum sp. Q0168]
MSNAIFNVISPTPLPTTNPILPQRTGDFSSIVEALDYAAQGETGLSFYGSTGQLLQTLRYRDLRSDALNISGKLKALGLGIGDTVAIVGETSPEFLRLFYGCQYAGMLPCPMPYSIFLGGRRAFAVRIASLVSASAATVLCIPDSLATLAEFWRDRGIKVITFTELNSLPKRDHCAPLDSTALAYIQFSSGSTADPKGIVISQRAVCENVSGILVNCIGIRPNDRAFSWLPFYHDMGLVGFSIAPLFAQTSVDYISPTTFARRPLLWPELISQNRSTITFAPVFGYRLAAMRKKDNSHNAMDLSSLRIAGIGGDTVRADQLELFAEAMRDAKFDPEAFTPSYGMAESTLLITFKRGVRTVKLDRTVLEKSGRVEAPSSGPTSSFTICGKPLPHHELIITDPNGKILSDGHLGHIHIRGPSMFTNYRNSLEAHPNSPTEFFDTGDMGFSQDGELIITGRSKEMIIVNGRNIWPQDIEQLVTSIPACASSAVAAFSIKESDDDETVVVLIERSKKNKGDTSLISQVISEVSSAMGIAVTIRFVEPKTLPFTSSGKLARSKARELYAQLRDGQTPHCPATP